MVITADRPSHLIDVGDGQTIRQENVYQQHIEYAALCKEGEEFQSYNETEINTALNTAIEGQGPVHINVPFSEPLYEIVAEAQITPLDIPPRLFSEQRLEGNLISYTEKWRKSPRKMVLVGTLPPHSVEARFLEVLANDPSVIVLTETTSNLHHPSFFPAIDQLISPLDDEEFKKLQPELLLTFGGMIVSKRIKAFLRKYTPKEHWHIGPKTANNTFFCLTKHFKNTPNYFFNHFLKDSKAVENYQSYWLKVRNGRLGKHDVFVAQVTYSDFKVYEAIFRKIPQQHLLQLANSTAIRYAQLFALHPSLSVFCNRGTSGIDGSTSTAIGAAVASGHPTVLVTGDLSFFYDSNALWNQYIPASFRIILVNNGGGGIFRILPKAKTMSHFERFFETKHSLTAVHLCAMFGFDYFSAQNSQQVENTLEEFFKGSDRPKLLEVFTPSEVNDLQLNAYFKAIG
ncbi:MAG: thiamine pyrophosphate-dependent enzyme [Flavobacteriaceae bacterium]